MENMVLYYYKKTRRRRNRKNEKIMERIVYGSYTYDCLALL